MKFLISYLYQKLIKWLANIENRRAFRVFQQTHSQRFSITKKDRRPCLEDRNKTTSFDKHYTYHTAWAARKLKELSPSDHVDISSLTYFSTLVSAFIPVKFYDYRPENIELSNFSCQHCDIVALPFDDGSLSSVSCMHVVEHIGLGRYGDPLDVNGDLKAIAELKRVVSSRGNLLFVVPIGGAAKIMFNAHRIYTYNQIVTYFDNFELKEFSLIPDKSREGIILNATLAQSNSQDYGCGCFLMRKL